MFSWIKRLVGSWVDALDGNFDKQYRYVRLADEDGYTILRMECLQTHTATKELRWRRVVITTGVVQLAVPHLDSALTSYHERPLVKHS